MRAFVRAVCSIAVVAVLLFPGAASSPWACGRIYLPDDEASRDRVRAVLEGLWGADISERRRTIAESELELELLGRILGDPEHEMRPYLVETVGGLVRLEEDDFTLSLFLKTFLYVDQDWARGVFREALAHDSPDVRRRAVQWYALHRDPDPEVLTALEDRWRIEDSPAIRANLIGALACQGSQRHADDLLRMARSDDPGFAPIAARALYAIDDWRVLPTLKSLLDDESEDLRMAALSALAFMPSSPEARESVARLVRDGPADLRGSGIYRIAEWPAETGTPLLLELASSAATTEDRSAAVRLVWHRDHPDVARTLRRIAEDASDPETEPFREYARSLLDYRDDPQFAEAFTQSRDADRVGCRFQTWDRDPNETDIFRPVPEPGLVSVRCWSSPGIVASSAPNPRIHDWETVNGWDLYEGREPWVLVSTEAAMCWVPRSSLEPVEKEEDLDGKDGPLPDAKGRLRFELDIEPELLGTSEIVELREAGVAEIIDATAGVIGLGLVLNLHDAAEMRRLLDLDGRLDEVFDDALFEIAYAAGERFGDDPALGPVLDEFFGDDPDAEGWE